MNWFCTEFNGLFSWFYKKTFVFAIKKTVDCLALKLKYFRGYVWKVPISHLK